VRCPVGISASGIVIEAHVCSSDSVGIGKAVLWRVQCNMLRSRGNSEDIMIVRCPVRHLGIVRRDRSCMSEQWATIQLVPVPVGGYRPRPMNAVPSMCEHLFAPLADSVQRLFLLHVLRYSRTPTVLRLPVHLDSSGRTAPHFLARAPCRAAHAPSPCTCFVFYDVSPHPVYFVHACMCTAHCPHPMCYETHRPYTHVYLILMYLFVPCIHN
jgi:hypothetical protein